MKRLITFHTQAGAIRFEKVLKADGHVTRLRPVPRQLSSSCGICVETSHTSFRDKAIEDLDTVYIITPEGYAYEWKNEQ